MGTKTDKLVEQLADTHNCFRDSLSRSGMSAQDQALLERQIARLEGSVADLTARLCEKGVARGVHQERRHVYYGCKADYVATRHATG